MSKAYTEQELRGIYQEYLEWFAQQTPELLRERRACWNWAGEVNQDGESTGVLGEPQPYSFETWQINDAAVVRVDELVAAVAQAKVRNQIKYKQWGQQVSLGNGEYAAFNPEYARNHERGQEINRQLGKMSSVDAQKAMDEIRKDNDIAFSHLAAVASGRLEEFQRSRESEESIPKKPQKQSTLANKAMHALWKMGFPVDKLTKLEFDVDVADEEKKP